MADPFIRARITRRMSNPWIPPVVPVSGTHYDLIEVYTENLETIDAINDEIGAIRFSISAPDNAPSSYFDRYQPKDVVELWINDGVNGSAYPNLTDRAFIGRIDRITPKLTRAGLRIEIEARDYMADLLEAEAFVLYYDATADEMLADLVVRFNAQRGSLAGGSQINSQPLFSLAADSLNNVIRHELYFFNSQSYFDAINTLASTYSKFTKLNYQYFDPLIPWNAGFNKIELEVRNYPGTGTLSFQVQEGVNLVSGSTARNIQGCKTKIKLYSKDGFGTPIYVEKEAATADVGIGANLGIDRYGEMVNWVDVDANARTFPFVNTIGDALISKLKQVRKEYQFEIYPGRMDIGKRLAGNMINVIAPSLNIPSPGEMLEVIQAKHRWDKNGLSTSLTLARYNPAFHRMICPPTKKTLDQALAEVYTGFKVYYLERAFFSDALTHEIGCYSYNPHDLNSRRLEFWLPNTGIFVEEGDPTNVLTNWNITRPDLVHTLRYTVEKSGNQYRITLYNEGDPGSPGGYMVAQSIFQGTNSTFTLVAQGGWGISGTVDFTGTGALLSANQRLHYGYDADNPANVLWMGYHRGHLFILTCHSTTQTAHVMRKFDLLGNLVDTWNIGTITDGTANRHVYEVSILAESDAPTFVFSIPFGYVRTAIWKGTLSAPARIKGTGVDQESIYPLSWWGPITYIGLDQHLLFARPTKSGTSSPYLQYYLNTFTTKIMIDSLNYQQQALDLLESGNPTDPNAMARVGKSIYSNADAFPFTGQSIYDSAGMKYDWNGGIWYMRTRENNTDLAGICKLARWGIGTNKEVANYLIFSYHTPINSIPRGLTLVPIRPEKQYP